MTAAEHFASAINTAYRNHDDAAVAMLRDLRDAVLPEVARLERSIEIMECSNEILGKLNQATERRNEILSKLNQAMRRDYISRPV